jgi:hypothetical protein
MLYKKGVIMEIQPQGSTSPTRSESPTSPTSPTQVQASAQQVPVIDTIASSNPEVEGSWGDSIFSCFCAPIFNALKAVWSYFCGTNEQEEFPVQNIQQPVSDNVAQGATPPAVKQRPHRFARELGFQETYKAFLGICENGKIQGNEELFKRADLINKPKKNGQTPLHVAAKHGSVEVVQQLIENGVEVTAIDKNGETALHHAARSGVGGLIFYLVGQGIPVDHKQKSGGTALHLAAAHGNKQAITALLTMKANVNAQDLQGRTPLWVIRHVNPKNLDSAVQKEIVDLLLSMHANPDIVPKVSIKQKPISSKDDVKDSAPHPGNKGKRARPVLVRPSVIRS